MTAFYGLEDADAREVRAKRSAERMSNFAVPKMGEATLVLEAHLFALLSKLNVRTAGRKGTGIYTLRDKEGRVFKVEVTQVEGPA